MSVLSNVVLIGAAGTVGSHILRALLEDSRFRITILSRAESSSTSKLSTDTHEGRVKIIRAEHPYASTTLISVFRGHDAVISATGVQTLSQQATWIRAAHDAGVRRFILNDYGNSMEKQTRQLPELEQFRTAKRECLALAKELAALAPTSTAEHGFSWSALATGNFIDYSLKKYPIFGFDFAKKSARLVDDGTERLSAVTLADIGRAVKGILIREEETRNRYLHIRSVETCQLEILHLLEEQMGEKWDVTYENSNVMYERGKKAFERGERSGMLDILVTQLFAKGGGRSIVTGKDESDNKLLGVEEKGIDIIITDVLATFDTV